jgi:hypothetical protein
MPSGAKDVTGGAWVIWLIIIMMILAAGWAMTTQDKPEKIPAPTPSVSHGLQTGRQGAPSVGAQ